MRGSQDRHDRRITREETFLPVNACRYTLCILSVSLLSSFWTVSLMNRARRRERDRKSAYMCVCSQRLAICSCHSTHTDCPPSCCSPLVCILNLILVNASFRGSGSDTCCSKNMEMECSGIPYQVFDYRSSPGEII